MGVIATEFPVDLLMLFLRLKWPIHRVRWIAARQIARLMRDPNTRPQMLQGFHQALAASRTSAECAALLNIVRVYDLREYFDEVALRAHTPHLCLLGDFCIASAFGHKRLSSSWIWSQSGPVPESFRPSPYFLRKKQSLIPPIFEIRLKKLSDLTGADLIAQWGYEWQALMDEGQFCYSSDPHYFMRGARRETLATGDVRQFDVLYSAFMRTLHFAVSFHDMPVDAAILYGTLGLALNRGLADIEIGAPPPELAAIQSDLRPDLTEPDARELIDRCAVFCGTDHLLSADLQGLEEGERRIELSVRTFLSEPEAEIDPVALETVLIENSHVFQAETLWEYDRALGRSGLSDLNEDLQSLGIVPLTRFPVSFCFGRWHSDLMSRQIELPASYLCDDALKLVPEEAGIEVRVGAERKGAWSVWATGWTPARPRNAAPALGTMTRFSRELTDRFAGRHGLALRRFARLTVWKSDQDYLPLEPVTSYLLD
jgi:hypothetical protein